MPYGKGTYGSKVGRPKKKVKANLAGMYGDPKKVTRGDIIAAAKKKKDKK
tara:strand:- start:221 stop:370 length:150 start_codon:yes stop_codon:yes gene_type:complete